MGQDKCCTISHAEFRDDDGGIAEPLVGGAQPLVLLDCSIEAMRAFLVLTVDLRPGRRQEHTVMVAMMAAKPGEGWRAGGMFESRSRVDQSAVEEYPAGC